MKKGQGLQDWQMLSIRMPKQQAERLELYVNKIGISKTALVLMLIDKELKSDQGGDQHGRETTRSKHLDNG